jgi:putative PIN family toxin of toxin-antitoxin system
VFLKALGNNKVETAALEHSRIKKHIICFSGEILREYRCKASFHGMTGQILLRKLSELEESHKLKKIPKINLQKAPETVKKHNCKLSTDSDDHKFIYAALASKANYVVTSDRGMLRLCPYACNNQKIEFLKPADYVSLTQ